MKNKLISDEVRRFVLANIPSIPHLEAILLLRNKPAHSWSIMEVAQRLYISENNAHTVLTDLLGAGIVFEKPDLPNTYHYHPSSSSLQSAINELAVTYASNLVGITELIHSKTSKKAQQFADAFKWRED